MIVWTITAQTMTGAPWGVEMAFRDTADVRPECWQREFGAGKEEGPALPGPPCGSGHVWCYGPLTKQKQYSSTPPEPSPGARKCSLSTMWLWPPTKGL